MDIKKLLLAFMICALIALPVTGYLTYISFNYSEDRFCNLGENFNCSKVSESRYSRFLGVPVAIWGFLTYLGLFVLSLAIYKDWKFKKIHKKLKTQHILYLLAGVSAFGTLFSLYLTYAEFFWIKAFCMFCLLQQGLIIIMFFLSLTAASFNKEIKLK